MTTFRSILTALCLGLSMFLFVGANSSSSIKPVCKIMSLNNSLIKLLNKTQTHFQPAFCEDKMHTIKLLTSDIRKDFLESCKARNQLMLFYRSILKNKKVKGQAKKHNILDDFMYIHEQLSSCFKKDCKEEDNTGAESMKKLKKTFNGYKDDCKEEDYTGAESMKKLKKKCIGYKDDCKEEDNTGAESMKKRKKKCNGCVKNKKNFDMVLKAISEFNTLLFWINCVINKEDADRCSY